MENSIERVGSSLRNVFVSGLAALALTAGCSGYESNRPEVEKEKVLQDRPNNFEIGCYKDDANGQETLMLRKLEDKSDSLYLVDDWARSYFDVGPNGKLDIHNIVNTKGVWDRDYVNGKVGNPGRTIYKGDVDSALQFLITDKSVEDLGYDPSQLVGGFPKHTTVIGRGSPEAKEFQREYEQLKKKCDEKGYVDLREWK